MAALGGVNLGDNVVWTDQRRWSTLRSTTTELLTGALLVEADLIQAGRPITLNCGWQTGSVLDSLQALADVARDENNPLTLVIPQGSYSVIFRTDQTPIVADPVLSVSDPGATTLWQTTLNLMEI